jgi:hypothetical protein
MTTSTKDELTKIQRGINYIAKHPNVRTPELAKALDADPKNVQAILWEAIKTGLILTCKVERPGQPPIAEFRLSSAANEATPPNWKEFSIGRRKADAQKKECSVTTQAGSGDITPAAAVPPTSLAMRTPGGDAAVVEPPTLDEKPAKVCSDEIGLEEIFQFDLKPLGDPDDDIDEISLPKSLAPVFGVSSDGQLTIHRRHSSGLVLTADETRSLYQFLGDSVRIWGAAL